ncbi:hypothetical protein Lser_V15G19970 [Lactuca serriola]
MVIRDKRKFEAVVFTTSHGEEGRSLVPNFLMGRSSSSSSSSSFLYLHGAMPTFTTVALDSLIEPKASKLASTGKTKPEPKLERRNSSSTLTKQGSGIHGVDGKPEFGKHHNHNGKKASLESNFTCSLCYP